MLFSCKHGEQGKEQTEDSAHDDDDDDDNGDGNNEDDDNVFMASRLESYKIYSRICGVG